MFTRDTHNRLLVWISPWNGIPHDPGDQPVGQEGFEGGFRQLRVGYRVNQGCSESLGNDLVRFSQQANRYGSPGIYLLRNSNYPLESGGIYPLVWKARYL